jgi:MFS family permease
MLLLSVLLFEVGSAICGAAPTMDALIVGRAIAGVGGAGIYLGGLNYFSIFTTVRERPMYIALIGLCWGVGTILGPVVGGLFADHSPTWRWAFYINLVIAGIFAPIYIFILPTKQPQPNVKLLTKFASMDWVGTFLFIGFAVTFILATTFGGATWAWSDHRMIVLWVVCAACLVTFIIQQRFSIFTTVEDRIFPAQLLKSKSVLLLYFATSGTITAVGIPIYFM